MEIQVDISPIIFHDTIPISILDEEATVSTLVYENGFEWNHKLVKHIFGDHEATSILSIPLSRNGAPDIMI